MALANDEHDELALANLEHDAIHAHPDAPQAGELALEDRTYVRIRRKSIELNAGIGCSLHAAATKSFGLAEDASGRLYVAQFFAADLNPIRTLTATRSNERTPALRFEVAVATTGGVGSSTYLARP